MPTDHGARTIKFARVGPAGEERPVVLTADGRVFDLSTITDDLNGSFWNAGGLEKTRQALAAGTLSPLDVDGLRFGPPVAAPGAIVCVGLNYVAHVAEADAPVPDYPVIFMKHPNTLVGPGDEVRIPPGAAKVDWEVELAVVIGRTARYLASPDQALAHIAGYTVSNDVSERHYQFEESGGQWSKGKCCETFNPMGPYLVPADQIANVQDLDLRSTVNGKTRQRSNTGRMIFDVAGLIHHLSQYLVLSPGDVVNTGTPEGVAMSGLYSHLRDGDVVRCEVDQIGALENRFVAAPSSRTPG